MCTHTYTNVIVVILSCAVLCHILGLRRVHHANLQLRKLHAASSFWVAWIPDANVKEFFKQVTDGERITLTLWFSRNSTHDEDVKLISRLSQIYSSLGTSGPPVPAPASSNMYLFSRDQSSHEEFGINICFARLLVLGFSIYSAHSENDLSEPHDLLLKPLQLTRGDELFDSEFSNILHALQVLQSLYLLPCRFARKNFSQLSVWASLCSKTLRDPSIYSQGRS